MIFRPDIKPPMWGSPDAVQYAIRSNAEEMGVNSKNVISVVPFWENGGNILHSYGRFTDVALLTNHTWKQNKLCFRGAATTITFGVTTQQALSFLINGVNKKGLYTLIRSAHMQKNTASNFVFLENLLGRYYGNGLFLNLSYDFPFVNASFSPKSNYNHQLLSTKYAKWQTEVLTYSILFQNTIHIGAYIDGKYVGGKDVSDDLYLLESDPSHPMIFHGGGDFYIDFDQYLMVHQILNQYQISLLNAQPYRLLMPVSRPVYFGAGTVPQGTLYSQNISGILGNLSGTTNETISYTLLTEGQI